MTPSGSRQDRTSSPFASTFVLRQGSGDRWLLVRGAAGREFVPGLVSLAGEAKALLPMRPCRQSQTDWISTTNHGPDSPSGHCTRISALVGISQPEVDPPELTSRVASSNRHLAFNGAFSGL